MRRLRVVHIVFGICVHSVSIIVLMAGRCKHPKQAPCTALHSTADMKASLFSFWHLHTFIALSYGAHTVAEIETKSGQCICTCIDELLRRLHEVTWRRLSQHLPSSPSARPSHLCIQQVFVQLPMHATCLIACLCFLEQHTRSREACGLGFGKLLVENPVEVIADIHWPQGPKLAHHQRFTWTPQVTHS